MAVDESMVEWVKEALEPLGTVTHRQMMGGASLYLDGTIFAILDGEGELFFKADDESAPIWDEAGCARFAFESRGERVETKYRHAPIDVYDDPEAMQQWAAIAVEAGLRGAAKKRKR